MELIFGPYAKSRQATLSCDGGSNTMVVMQFRRDNSILYSGFKSIFRGRRCASRLAAAVVVFVLSCLAFDRASAQSQDIGNDLSLYLGSMLPNQIDGVTEILPVFGGRYSIATQAGSVEMGLANTHAMGVDFTTAELSLRGDVPVGEGMTGIIYGGIDLN